MTALEVAVNHFKQIEALLLQHGAVLPSDNKQEQQNVSLVTPAFDNYTQSQSNTNKSMTTINTTQPTQKQRRGTT